MITARNLHKSFKTKTGLVKAVDGVEFEAPDGQITGLLGPNGAGKTTTVEVCQGFLRADAGDVRVLGVDPAGAPDALRAATPVFEPLPEPLMRITAGIKAAHDPAGIFNPGRMYAGV